MTTAPAEPGRPDPNTDVGVAVDPRPIAVFDLTVLDTPDPGGLARFYCALLGCGSPKRTTIG